MSEPVLQVENAAVQVANQSLLQQVTLSVEQGRHLALIGANGAGKSTLIKIILGISPKHWKVTGLVRIQGEDLSSLDRKGIAQKVAYVPQLLATEIPYSVREFITMGRYVFDGKSEEVVERVMELVKITDFAEREVSTLSGGECQRVCIAAALAQEAPIILLDEPLAHLDPGQRLEVQRTLRTIGEMVTLVVITHDIRWVQRDFSHVVALKKGEVIFDGDTTDLEPQKVMKKLFGIDLTEEELII